MAGLFKVIGRGVDDLWVGECPVTEESEDATNLGQVSFVVTTIALVAVLHGVMALTVPIDLRIGI